jgi:hypothetical protein
MSERPTFSLIHTTRRLPHGWIPAYFAWLAGCVRPQDVEYILAVDVKDSDKVANSARTAPIFRLTPWGYEQSVLNFGRTCAVDGWNAAARASTGRFLITVADDLYPCPQWDEQIRALVPDMNLEAVLDVNYGPEATPGFCYFSFVTRARYERLGYVFYPEYWGMIADNDFTEHAQQDGVIVNARHLLFPHLHYTYGLSKEDETYRWQQRPEAYAIGEEIIRRRRLANFVDVRELTHA